MKKSVYTFVNDGRVARKFAWLGLAFLPLLSCSSQSRERGISEADSLSAISRGDSVKKVQTIAVASTTLSAGTPIGGADTLKFNGVLPDTALLPGKRIVAYYGNPHSKRMGILGEYPREEMLRRLDQEVKNWSAADPQTPIQPALHLVAISAQGSPGKDGKYRMRMGDKTIRKIIRWGAEHGSIVFLDIQVGLGSLSDELHYLKKYLELPYVHLGIDPEFSMKTGHKPGKKIGTYDASDISYAVDFLSKIVKENNLPPKIFVVHRFTQGMVTNYRKIKLDPNVQIVMNMDGWGQPVLKKDTYRAYIKKEPVQFTGFKLFYKNDLKKPPHILMTPKEVLALDPKPIYIQYQ